MIGTRPFPRFADLCVDAEGLRLLLPGHVSAVELSLPSGLPHEAWSAIGDRLLRLPDVPLFWVGDWLVYGRRTYGQVPAVDLPVGGRSERWLRRAIMTAASIHPDRRIAALTFQHHAEVASLPPADQDELLALALADGIGVRRLREMVRRRRYPAPPPEDVAPVLVRDSDAELAEQVCHLVRMLRRASGLIDPGALARGFPARLRHNLDADLSSAADFLAGLRAAWAGGESDAAAGSAASSHNDY